MVDMVHINGAHPRPCGEHHLQMLPAFYHEGSSPPVRGALATNRANLGVSGLIPARAGSTF